VSSLPPVVIVMCTYNGARWLPEQLDSFAQQDHTRWSLVVSDNGSSDTTCDILRAFAKDHPVTLYEMPRGDPHLSPPQRAARHYMRTLTRPDLPIEPGAYLALSDQDDIWRADKLSHALTALAPHTDRVALYGGQSRHILEDGTPLAYSRTPRRAVGMHNALVQNVVSGHSAMLTPGALAQLRAAGLPDNIWYHDWWIYLLITAIGGQVVIDDHVGLDYRQHSENVMGAGRGYSARLRRLKQIFNGEYGQWMRANLAALAACDTPLSHDTTSALAPLETSLGPSALWRSGAYRHTALETLCLYLAAALHKL